MKMGLEAGQMLCTNIRVLFGTEVPYLTKSGQTRKRHTLKGSSLEHLEDVLYKTTHPNHSCTVWARKTAQNFEWLLWHGLAILEEYTRRYGRVHATQAVLEMIFEDIVPQMCLPDTGLTKPYLAMPEKYHDPDPVKAYRQFYYYDKHLTEGIIVYPEGKTPSWFLEMMNRSRV